MIVSAAGYEAYLITWGVLLFASAGVFHHSGIKIPYFAFFAHDSGKRCDEAPLNMLIAMGLAAFMCIAIGVAPGPLYALLPYPVEYAPYTASHVLAQLQLLMFSALAFSVLMWTRIYPPELRSVNLDFDWLYRGPGKRLALWLVERGGAMRARLLHALSTRADRVLDGLFRSHGPHGVLARTSPTGSMVLWVAVLLAVLLLASYL
jgi:multicomponent Na+:H+ antiporter subunit D